MEFPVNIELMDDGFYKEVEIDIFEIDENNNAVLEDTIVFDDIAWLQTYNPDDGLKSRRWVLVLKDPKDRHCLNDVKYLRFMVSVYQNSDEEPYPAQGKLVYRRPLVDKMFVRPDDPRARGNGTRLNLWINRRL
jgi:hypothetical protein